MNAHQSAGLEDPRAELLSSTCRMGANDTIWEIPFASNAVELTGDLMTIFDTGVHNWSTNEHIRMYVHANEACELKLALFCKVPHGRSTVEIKVLGVPQVSILSGSEYHTVPIGKWKISGPGVVTVDLKGVEKTGGYFADVTHLGLASTGAQSDAISFLDDSDETKLYWQRMRLSQTMKKDIIETSGNQSVVDLHAEFISASADVDVSHAWEIPFSSNSVELNGERGPTALNSGLHNWNSKNKRIRIYFGVKESCEIELALNCKVPHGESRIMVTVLGYPEEFHLSGSEYHIESIGKWKISDAGCVTVDIEGVEKTGAYFGDVTNLIVSHKNMEDDALSFLSDSHKNKLYWQKMFRLHESCDSEAALTVWKIPFSSNSSEVNGDPSTVYTTGIHIWTGHERIRLYFYVEEPCELNFALRCRVPEGNSKIEVTVLEESRVFSLVGSEYHNAPIGNWKIPDSGWVAVDFKGVEKTDNYFADVKYLVVSQRDMNKDAISFLDDSNSALYWHRMGLSQKINTKDTVETNDSEPVVNIDAEFVSALADIDVSNAWAIPFSSNSVVLNGEIGPTALNSGLHNWNSKNKRIRIYFCVKQSCEIELGLKCKVPAGESTIRVTVLGDWNEFHLSGSEYHIESIGKWKISDPGCVTLDLEGVEKTGAYFGDVTNLIVSHKNMEDDALSFLSDSHKNKLYWQKMFRLHESCDSEAALTVWKIPFSSNSSEVNGDPSTVYTTGIHIWTGHERIRLYFYVEEPCELNFALRCRVPEGNSKIEVTVLEESRVFSLVGSEYHNAPIGNWKIPDSGWVAVDFKGVEKTDNYFADVKYLVVSQRDMNKDAISFLDDSNSALYWHRMGLSQKINTKDTVETNDSEPVVNIDAEFVSALADIDVSNAWAIPFSSNSVVLNGEIGPTALNSGLHKWNSKNKRIRIYFCVKQSCEIELGLKCKVPAGESTIRVTVLGVRKEFHLSGSEYHIESIGKWKISDPGCVTLDLEGVEKTGAYFGDVTNLIVSHKNMEDDALSFLSDSHKNKLYWQKMFRLHKFYDSDAALTVWKIPLSSNSFKLNGDHSTVLDTGIHSWTGHEIIRLYFYVKEPCELNFALTCKVPEGNSKIEVKVLEESQVFSLDGSEYHNMPIGKWKIPDSGWVAVDFKGVEKTDYYFADVKYLLVSQRDMDEDAISFLDNRDESILYCQRRGPPRKHLTQDAGISVNSSSAEGIYAKFLSPKFEFDQNSAAWMIPFSSNSAKSNGDAEFTAHGTAIHNWTVNKAIRLYFYVKESCKVELALKCKVPNGNSKIRVKVLDVPKVCVLSGSEYHNVPLGEWEISDAGCVTVEIEGIEKTHTYFADITHLVVSKAGLDEDSVSFLDDSTENILYWQRIGPPEIGGAIAFNSNEDAYEDAKIWMIPFSSNSLALNGDFSTVSDNGHRRWSADQEIRTHFYVNEACELNLALRCKVHEGISKIEVHVLGASQVFELSGSEYHIAPIGKWNIQHQCVTVDLKGIENIGDYIADITDLIVYQTDMDKYAISFLDGSKDSILYWQRRGPPSKEKSPADIHAEFLSPMSKIDNYDTIWQIPFTSNSVELKGRTDSIIFESGIHQWKADKEIRLYFYVNGPCELNLALMCTVPDGSSKVEVSVLGVPQVFTLSGSDYHAAPVGKWRIAGEGCVTVDLKAAEKTDGYVADATHLVVTQSDLEVEAVAFLEGTQANRLYWKRRGPPKVIDVELPNDLHAKFVGSPTKIDDGSPKWEISFAANSWSIGGDSSVVGETGVEEWDGRTVRLYLRLKDACQLDLALRCKVPVAASDIRVEVLGVGRVFRVSGSDYHLEPIGKWDISGAGYVTIDFVGVSKSGEYYADLTHLVVPRAGLDEDSIVCLDSSNSRELYWRRRGPAIYLNYQVPEDCKDPEYYYNEVMVPTGYDNLGMYCASIGFGNGYFGIQIISTGERRVLFSVWSPQSTDDPKTLMDENQVILVNKDPETVAHNFGGEGSGGQSYLPYNWLPDVTYKFLLRGRPDPMIPGYTLYTAWFGEKDSPHWRLIAELSRPRGTGYLAEFHSFLESVQWHTSHNIRMARLSNQWVRDKTGRWFEATAANFTGDDRTRAKLRLDFEGGVTEDEDGFYMKHCGFFVGRCNAGERLHRRPSFLRPFGDLVTKKQTELKRNLTVEFVDTDDDPDSSSEMFRIPIHSNGWLSKEATEVIQRPNLGNWTSSRAECHVFFYVGRPTVLDLFMRCKVPKGRSVIDVEVCGVSRQIDVDGDDYHVVLLGRCKFKGRDYAEVVLRGVSRQGSYFGDVTDLMVPKDQVTSDHVICIPDDEEASAARRAPTPSLVYRVPQAELPDELYYAEVLVPRSNPAAKVVAIGFDCGFVGIQDNEVTFVMSLPEDGDARFEGAADGEDNSGNTITTPSGVDGVSTSFVTGHGVNVMKSVAHPNWEDEDEVLACKFLVRMRKVPGQPGRVSYGAWFEAGSGNEPRKISEVVVAASSTVGGLRGFHSSVETLHVERSHQAAKATFGLQAVRKVDGRVFEVTDARIQVVGAVETRALDYDAGVQGFGDEKGEGFFLRTGGFVIASDINGTVIARKPDGLDDLDKYLDDVLTSGI